MSDMKKLDIKKWDAEILRIETETKTFTKYCTHEIVSLVPFKILTINVYLWDKSKKKAIKKTVKLCWKRDEEKLVEVE